MEFEKITTDIELSKKHKEAMEKAQKIVANHTNEKMQEIEKILQVIMEENPGLTPKDCIIEFDTDHNPIAVYKKVKIYDFKEGPVD